MLDKRSTSVGLLYFFQELDMTNLNSQKRSDFIWSRASDLQ